MKTNRRDFLKLSAAAAAASLPTLWLPKRAYAATPGFGAAKHVMVLFAKGGFRSHCTFNAIGTNPNINPFGARPDAAGRIWKLGALGLPAPYAASSYTPIGGGAAIPVPSFETISPDVTVLGCVDHNPAGGADVDHRTATNRIATGDPYGMSGLLSLIGKDHPLYANGFSLTAMPPVEVQPTEFGLGAGSYANTRPLSVQAGGGFAADKPIGKGWKMQSRADLDMRFRNTRSRAYRSRLNNFLASKQNAAVFADVLKDPKLNFAPVDADPGTIDAGTAVADGFSNAQLMEILGNTVDPMYGMSSWGPDVAMALRFFTFGSPFAVVTRDMYDMHDEELTMYAPRVQDLTKQLAGLHYLLHAMDHPAGGKYWDHTIVCTVSEFSRNNTGANGFNSGNGSDHVGQDAGPARNQALAVMGGPVTASKGKIIGPTDASINATIPTEVFSSRQLLATLVDALGVNQNYFGADPIQELYL